MQPVVFLILTILVYNYPERGEFVRVIFGTFLSTVFL